MGRLHGILLERSKIIILNEKYHLEINGQEWPHGEWDLSLTWKPIQWNCSILGELII